MPDDPAQIPAPAPPVDPSEGRERADAGRRDPRDEPRFATPEWRREPTTENDPRKGR
jgi:hypothetical protein